MNPVSLTHPSAPAAAVAQGPAPRYLVRADGVVLDYNPWLARLPGFTPADVLPPAHLVQIAAAQARDAALAQVLAQRQAALQQAMAAPVAEPQPPHAPVAAGPHEAEAIARARFRAQLKPAFERAGLAMDLRKPMETLRAEALASLQPKAALRAAAKEV
jgi:hypothetical protein